MADQGTSWLWRFGEELDRFINVALLNGQVGETISLHAATDAQQGQRWACWLCAFLSATVEKDHCPKTLAGQNISQRGGLIAGALLLAVFLVVTGAFWWFVFR